MICLILQILYKISYIHNLVYTQIYINFSRQEHQIDVLHVSFKIWDSQVSAYSPFHFSFTVPLRVDKEFYLETWSRLYLETGLRIVLPWDWMKISTLRLEEEFFLETGLWRVLPRDWTKSSILRLDKEEFYLETRWRVLPLDWSQKSSTLRLDEEFYLETILRILPWDWIESFTLIKSNQIKSDSQFVKN